MTELLKDISSSTNDTYSWVHSLPFFPELLKRIKIILIIILVNRHHLIKSIKDQRKNAIKKIIRCYQNYKLINKLKKEFLIRKIIEDRKQSIIKIQRYFKYFLNKKLLKKIIRKEKGRYIIICHKSNVLTLSIKLFTDYKDNSKSEIYPMRYCPFRKYYVFGIPKTKFILADKEKKIVNFNFIYKGNIFFEDHYKIVDFNGKKVHTTNFSHIDKNIAESNFIKFCKSTVIDDNNSLCLKVKKQQSCLIKKDMVLDFSSDEEEEKKTSRKTSKDLNGNKKQKFVRKKKKGKTYNLKSSKVFKFPSILKDKNIIRKNARRSCSIIERHVQFGTVTFSY